MMCDKDQSCDHMLGLASCEFSGENVKGNFIEIVRAEVAGWKGDGIVSTAWIGEHFNFCPSCGVALGDMLVGYRGEQI